ncbi:MAG: cold shock domain-containing protein [Fluviicoccus sp.]|uniref:cold shock domain-containing protein n=1 Tax=Fluviicoccus sp. TaxID=2003552 RepID=UPI00271B9AC9|nr:cold shock domain-containing protein [Fluviicoccus sp.]MDO8330801.1 cold shock domain-containing protein [Fluviicoccus sp.]
MASSHKNFTKIGIFYDGNFFLHVSNYYQYYHNRKSRISISGLHDFIRHRVATEENTDVRYCHIVDAHYFRGRLRAQDAEQRDLLLKERLFDEVLMREGVTTHYLPLGPDGEKGIDVWLALEAYELSIYKQFDVLVLVACDGDFRPLLRKLNTINTRVMLLAWDFEYLDRNNMQKLTRTAQVLLDEATYPVLMHQLIDDRSLRSDAQINNLFLYPKEDQSAFNNGFGFGGSGNGHHHASPATHFPPLIGTPAVQTLQVPHSDIRNEGSIQSLKEGGFGFITPDDNMENVFFHFSEVKNRSFASLHVGDRVSFLLGRNDKGFCATQIQVITPEQILPSQPFVPYEDIIEE